MTSSDAEPPADPLTPTLRRELEMLQQAGLHRSLRRVERGRGLEVRVDGRPMTDFSSNDYHGLATDPRVAEAIALALAQHGTGAAAARSISGNCLVGAVRPPSVPLGKARLRITLSAGHTCAQLDTLLTALADVLPHPHDVY